MITIGTLLITNSQVQSPQNWET